MQRHIYDNEHKDFAESFSRFLAEEITPNMDAWEADGLVPRETFAAAGAHGFTGMAIPEEYGGVGVDDFRFNAVIGEECGRANLGGYTVGLTLHNDITTPYFLEYCTDEQKQRWLPGIASGEQVTAIAMTEPEIGSDLAGMKANAIDQGDHYLLNGAKTFITNGINGDLIVTAVKTDPSEKHRGISLIVVERDMEGFERGRNLEKIGQHCQDTAELFFNDVVVPKENLLGEEGKGFNYLVSNLAQERLSIAVYAVAAAEAAFEMTAEYVRDRNAFGKAIGSFQNTRFELADIKTKIDVGRSYLDRCVEEHVAGRLTAEDAAASKLWCTELQGEVADRCLQLFGGYGFMTEYPIARNYADARVTRIYGGTNEIMKEIVGRSLNLG